MKTKILLLLFSLNLGVIQTLSSKDCNWDCTVSFSMSFETAYTSYSNDLRSIGEEALQCMATGDVWCMYNQNNQLTRARQEYNLAVSIAEYQYCDCGCCNW